MLYLSDIVFWAASKDFKESGEGCISPAKGMFAAYMCDSDQDTCMIVIKRLGHICDSD